MTPKPPAFQRGLIWTRLMRYGAPGVIFAAALPFGSAPAVSVWAAAMVILLVARGRADALARHSLRAALETCLGLAYATAALHLLMTGNTAAEVLATTMLGVGLFAVLVRDYRDPKRLIVNVTPYVGVILVMQVMAVDAALRHHNPALIATIVAAPLLVGNVFMLLHRDLVAAHRGLAVALARAETAAQTKGEFLADMSHEIRTPLNAVLGFTSLLERSCDLCATDLSHVHAIRTAGQDLLAVVDDVLDSTRLEAGMVKISPQATAILPFLEDSLGLFAPIAMAKGLHLDLEIGEGCRGALLVDQGRLRQILSNLISNALKFTTCGEVKVRASYSPGAERLSIEVEDTGIGLSADDAGRLFKRFTQVDGVSRRTSGGGSGLGLAISRDLAQLMGGDLSVRSRLGTGSTFRLDLPARQVEASAPQAFTSTAGALAGGSSTVLVVDDHPANRRLVRLMLEAAGHRISDASSGLEALQLCEEQAFDVVLMDLQMPGMSGFEAAAAIRRSKTANAATPIVALSADVFSKESPMAEAAAFDAHLAKPISTSELIAAVSRFSARAPDDRGGRTRPRTAGLQEPARCSA